NLTSSTSATAAHQVDKAATATAIVSDVPDPTAIGQPYTVTYGVTVTGPGSGTPSGAVTVGDGTDQCVGMLPAMSCQLTSTTAGAKMLVATYAGDANFQGSVSPIAAHTVNGSAHQLTVTRKGSGSGTVTSGDLAIDCGATCAQSYADGTDVTLTA